MKDIYYVLEAGTFGSLLYCAWKATTCSVMLSICATTSTHSRSPKPRIVVITFTYSLYVHALLWAHATCTGTLAVNTPKKWVQQSARIQAVEQRQLLLSLLQALVLRDHEPEQLLAAGIAVPLALAHLRMQLP